MLNFAIESDQQDPLKEYRNTFVIPGYKNRHPRIYLCGHSLGLQPLKTKKEMDELLHNWGNDGVRAHFDGSKPWIAYPSRIEEAMASLVGAEPEEVCLMNGLTVNLHLLLQSFYNPQDKIRTKILIEDPCFPSDRYVIASHLKTKGYQPDNHILLWKRNQDTNQFSMHDLQKIFENHGHEIALILLGGVNYHNGALLEMEEITKIGHRHGSLVGFDLAHAAGNVELNLSNWNVDFAAWCTYKYLNGGPGSLGGIFIHKKHLAKPMPRLEGWWGNTSENRFEMLPEFTASQGASAWQLSNPPILSMPALKVSSELFEAVGMKAIRAKSIQLTRYMEEQLLDLDSKDLHIYTPRNISERGAMITFTLGEKTYATYRYLLDHDVVVDYRNPNIIRVAPVPLYNRFEDVFHFVRILKESLYLNRLN